MKRRILVKVEDYKNYINKYGTDKLDLKNEIYCTGSFPPKFYREENNINEEIFEGIECSYSILEKTDNKIHIMFLSKSNNEYRLDILKDISNIWHIGFSESDNSLQDTKSYELVTNKNEAIDVLSRLVWILKDFNMNVEYCIGATGDTRKDTIYEFMMRFVSNWERRESNEYELGWALYFKI